MRVLRFIASIIIFIILLNLILWVGIVFLFQSTQGGEIPKQNAAILLAGAIIIPLITAIKFYKSKKAPKAILMPEKPKVEVDASKMNYCPNCGSKLNEGVNFCSNCGNKIK